MSSARIFFRADKLSSEESEEQKSKGERLVEVWKKELHHVDATSKSSVWNSPYNPAQV